MERLRREEGDRVHPAENAKAKVCSITKLILAASVVIRQGTSQYFQTVSAFVTYFVFCNNNVHRK